MEKYNVTFLQSALDDLQEIVLYIAVDSKEHALLWHDKLMSIANKLSIFPLMGILVPDEKISRMGFRMSPIGDYLLFYKVYEKDSEVTILRVLHAKRDYSNLFTDYARKDEE